MTQLGSRMGGKVADARKGEAHRAKSGIAAGWSAVARAAASALLVAVLVGLAACTAAPAPALPDPGPNGVELTIKSAPDGASIVIDGIAAGTAPLKVKLRPGPHRMRASLTGYYPGPDTRVQVGATEPPEVTLHLVASH